MAGSNAIKGASRRDRQIDRDTGHDDTPRRLSRPARWRILSLTLVHVAIAAHIFHWRMAGESMSSIQLSDAGRFAAEGVATAALFLMAFLLVTTAIFGRFFCAWGCHMLALQEACRLVLQRLGARPKLVRSRIVWLIPFAAAFYIFLAPAVERWWTATPMPMATVELSTDNLWANLPSPAIGLATMFMVGIAMVYFLGSLSFCKYVCPYGALFAAMENLSLGRIRLTGDCDGCASCTAACTTGVRVHEEIQRLGMVASTGCMRCFECVSACPQKAIHYRFGRPAIFATGRSGLTRYAFSRAEEGLMLVLFIAGFAALHGLYDALPLLFSLTGAVLIAYLGVVASRVTRRSFVTIRGFHLKESGRLRTLGVAFTACVIAVYGFVGHSLFIQYHEVRANTALRGLGFPRLQASFSQNEESIARQAADHLEHCEALGLSDTVDWNMKSAWLYRVLGEPSRVEQHLRRAIVLGPEEPAAHFNLGKELLRQGKRAEAVRAFVQALKLEPSLERFLPGELFAT